MASFLEYFQGYSGWNEKAFPNPVPPYWTVRTNELYLGSLLTQPVDLYYDRESLYPYGLVCRNYTHWGHTIDTVLGLAVVRDKLGVPETNAVRAAFALLVEGAT